jgi:hypothetical protein
MKTKTIHRVAGLLEQAAQTHHAVFWFVDGQDDDWATWYADWLVNHSPLAEILGAMIVRSRLTALLVEQDRLFEAQAQAQDWSDFYARAIVEEFGPPA